MPQYLGSTTPVANGGTYTSKWVLADIYGQVSGSIFTDRASVLHIEQSGDGTHADVSATYSVTANAGSGYSENLILPWVRLRVENNSGSNQTVLRLFSRFSISGMP